MKILLSGAAGYTGKGVAEVLRRHGHFIRSIDIVSAGEAVDESVVADLADLTVCRQAIDGMEAVVLCHMAPNPAAYKEPPLAFDVNVKGTANLYHAAVEHGTRRSVLISSYGLVDLTAGREPSPGDGPYQYKGTAYILTKILQEATARFYFENHGICTAILRPGWIVYDSGTFATKYGWNLEYYDPTLIDPRDIGEATALALALPDLALETFPLGQADAAYDDTQVRERLGWEPAHRFEKLPRR